MSWDLSCRTGRAPSDKAALVSPMNWALSFQRGGPGAAGSMQLEEKIWKSPAPILESARATAACRLILRAHGVSDGKRATVLWPQRALGASGRRIGAWASMLENHPAPFLRLPQCLGTLSAPAELPEPCHGGWTARETAAPQLAMACLLQGRTRSTNGRLLGCKQYSYDRNSAYNLRLELHCTVFHHNNNKIACRIAASWAVIPEALTFLHLTACPRPEPPRLP